MMRAMMRHPIRFTLGHRYTQAHASDYVDDELDSPGRHRIDEHTGVCRPCRHLVASLRRIVTELTSLRARPETSVAEDVIQRLRAEP